MHRHCLLFDRRWIWPMEGAWAPTGTYRFRVFEPSKLDEPLLAADKPWEAMSTGWHTLLYDQGIYRCWYEAWDEGYTTDADGRLCYAESQDGLAWTKPELGLIEFRGSKENNIVADASTTMGLGFHGSSVFVDPTASAAERYKLIFIGSTRSFVGQSYGPTMLMQAFSADGLHWQMKTHPMWGGYYPPLLAYASDTQSVAFWDPGLRKYVGFFRSWEPGYARSVARAETSDFYNWPLPHTVLHCDEHDQFGTDIYNNAANRYESGGDVGYFLFMSMFEHGADTLDVQLATSRDSRLWSRSDRARFIRNGPQAFDRGGIYVAPSIIPFRGALAVAYHGCSFKHGEAVPDKVSYQGAMGMVILAPDRFQGLHTDGEFECCLEPFALEGDRLRLRVNALTAPDGEVRAALVVDGKVVEGRDFAHCQPVSGDEPDRRLRWEPGSDLTAFVGKQATVRLRLKMATVFAVDIRC